MTSHDQLAKDLLRTFFADLLVLVLPDVAPRLELGKPVFLDKELFTTRPEGERREVDLLARVQIRCEKATSVLVHIEIEARARADMDRRMWEYYMLIRLRYELPVMPIVFYLRGGPLGVEERAWKEGYAPGGTASFRYHAFGLSRCRAEDYLVRPEPLAWALAALMRPGRWTRAGLKMECLRRVARGELTDFQRLLLANFVETYLQLSGPQAEEYDRLRQLAENREVVAMRKTWAEQIHDEGRQAGRAEGVEALRGVVLSQLEQRFGALPQRTKRKIERISSLEPLTHLAQRIVVAESIEELGL